MDGLAGKELIQLTWEDSQEIGYWTTMLSKVLNWKVIVEWEHD